MSFSGPPRAHRLECVAGMLSYRILKWHRYDIQRQPTSIQIEQRFKYHSFRAFMCVCDDSSTCAN